MFIMKPGRLFYFIFKDKYLLLQCFFTFIFEPIDFNTNQVQINNNRLSTIKTGLKIQPELV